MDGSLATQRRISPGADPRIARVKLPMLFAWLAEAEAAPSPLIVFEAVPVSNEFPPVKRRRRHLPAPIKTKVHDLSQPGGDAAPVEVERVFEAPPAPEPAPVPVLRLQVEPPPLQAVQTARQAEPETPPSLPPFLPPPLIAPVISPRPRLSRVDDFLPSRASLRPADRPKR